jgi:hypothetical protein
MGFKRSHLALLSAAAVSAWPGAALAAEPRFGSAAFQSARFCRDGVNGTGNILAADVDCMGPANPDQRRKDTRIPGGEGVTINTTSDMTIGGRLVSKVAFGELDLPVVKSGAWADDDTRVASSIVTYMGFNFGGTEAIPYALDATIDWTGSGAPLRLADIAAGETKVREFGGEGFGGFTLVLMDAAFVPVFPDANAITSYSFYEGCGFAGVLGINSVNMTTAAAGYSEAGFTLDTACGGGQLMLEPGKDYVLFTFMQTVANRGGVLDATNTIRVKLSETLPEEAKTALRENVVTARSLVPEPASWAMMIAGFGLVGAAVRRQKRGLQRA